MVIRKRIIHFTVLLSVLLGSCQPMEKRQPVTQPWEATIQVSVPTDTVVPTEIPTPTPVPEMVLVEPNDVAFTPTPFAINQQGNLNLFALPSAGENHIYGLYGFPPDINPLTGEKVDDPAILERRPILSKISNFPAGTGRPHAGLSYADVVFEYYIGEYMNRFRRYSIVKTHPKPGPCDLDVWLIPN